MPLAPEVQVFLEQIEAMGTPELHTLPVSEARATLAALAALQGEPRPVAAVADRTIPGPQGEIPVRVYTPSGSAPWPVLVYFHGGGWVLGGLDTHDGTCRSLASGADCIVVSVDYRLAPENKFPAAAGVAVRCTRYAGIVHGFFGLGAVLPQAQVAVDDATAALRAAFGTK